MADLSITPVATQIRPVPQMSLADMVGLARGVQAYQQAQQINPIEVQSAQQAARLGQIKLGVEEQANIERQNMQRFFADPENFQTDNRIDMNKINAAVPKIAPLTGSEYIRKYSDLSTAQTAATEAKQNLTESQRKIFGSAAYVLGRAGIQDPKAYMQAFDDVASQFPSDTNVKKLADAYKLTWSQIPPGAHVPDIAIKGAQTLIGVPSLQTAFAPTVSTTAEGRTITTQPQPGVAAPTVTIGTAGGVQTGAAPGARAPTGPGATPSAAGFPLKYPVRTAAQPFIPEPSEARDKELGAAYRSNLQEAQSSLISAKRNTDEVINQAKKIEGEIFNKQGGLLAQAEQKARMAIGSAEYDMLSKDLANMALANSKALGNLGNTVAGLNMQEVANGSIKVPPGVLVNIARRVQADQRNIDMQSTAAQRFTEKFGDNNLPAFRDQWAKNGESKIFEAMNLMREIQDPTRLNQELNKLFPKPGERQEMLKKYRNIKSLTETGTLPKQE